MGDARIPELWEDVLARWGEERAHTAFIEHCRLTQQLDQAARLYRAETQPGTPYRDDPSHAELAHKKLKSIAALAMMQIEASRAAHRPVAGAFYRRLFFFLFVFGLLVGAFLLRQRSLP
jgi:hypothetical protein